MSFIVQRQIFVRHPEHEWMTATLDAIDCNGEIWEFKAAGLATAKGLEDGNPSTLPSSWQLQGHHQMIVAGVNSVNFAVFVGHRLRLYRFRLDFNVELAESLMELETEFWDHVQRDQPPAEFDAADAQVLQRYFKGQEPGIELTAREIELADQWRQATKLSKEMADQADECKAGLLWALGNHTTGQAGPYTIQRKLIEVKANPNPKPKEAYSYVRFSIKGGDDGDE